MLYEGTVNFELSLQFTNYQTQKHFSKYSFLKERSPLFLLFLCPKVYWNNTVSHQSLQSLFLA